MKSLREIIRERGAVQVAKDLGVSEEYARHVLNGRRQASANLLRKAEAAYGDEINVRASVRDNGTSDLPAEIKASA